MGSFVAAIDQGTTSTRLILFDRDGRIAAIDQREHEPDDTPRPAGSSTTPPRSGCAPAR
jgi:glycerol kinase